MPAASSSFGRLRFLRLGFLLAGLLILGQLFRVQVLSHGFYSALADGQHDLFQKLFPERGRIYATGPDGSQKSIFAANRKLSLVYAVPFLMKDPKRTAHLLAPILALDEADLIPKLSDPKSQYRALKHLVPDEVRAQVEALDLVGIGFSDEEKRFYPEGTAGAQLLGFVGPGPDGTTVGHYGIEGYFNDQLTGTQGFLDAQKDSFGRLLADGVQQLKPAKNGDDIVLTVDPTVEHVVCQKLADWVQLHGASQGSVVILDPKTGAVIAMCNAPSFDPNAYNQVNDISVYNNTAIFTAWEPGSIFKTITMAAGLDTGKITPDSTFNDPGEEKIGPYTIRNADHKAHGVVTMTYILAQSLNTGVGEVVRRVGNEAFLRYAEAFGFGQKTGIELQTESAGTIDQLRKPGDIYAATGAFGQGITATPLQMVNAYAAIANGGMLVKPYVVSEIRHADTGAFSMTAPKTVRRVVSEKTAKLLTGMLVAVVETGEGKRAAVPGYWVAGKTGTAQIPDGHGGYETGTTIGAFAGFAPIGDPKFAMIVRIDRPRDVQFAESSAAPLWGSIAKYLLDYYEIPPTRK